MYTDTTGNEGMFGFFVGNGCSIYRNDKMSYQKMGYPDKPDGKAMGNIL